MKQREREIENLRFRYRKACRERKQLTCDLLARRMRELVLQQIKYELREERRSVA